MPWWTKSIEYIGLGYHCVQLHLYMTCLFDAKIKLNAHTNTPTYRDEKVQQKC